MQFFIRETKTVFKFSLLTWPTYFIDCQWCRICITMIFLNFFSCSALVYICLYLKVAASDGILESAQDEVPEVNNNVCETESCVSSESFENPTEKVRIVTKEELAFHDGNQTETLWLSIMSKVFDVSAGPEYYSKNAPYRVFVGRDGNVPFITGAFNPDEASKPLTDLEPHQLLALEHWSQFYVDEAKYHFVGLLEGELYDKDGNPTEVMYKVQEMIAVAKIAAEERKKKTAEIIAKRRREAEERQKISKS
jgi:Cytochrome b5-like Heme/Steroid binding domain